MPRLYDAAVEAPRRQSRRTQRDAKGRVWLLAWVAALAFHAALFLVFQKLPPLQAASAAPRVPEPIQLTFEPLPPETQASDEPQMFSELPPDRADEAPEKPQFLSNVTSRARDRVPGGDTQLPRMEGEIDAPLVALRRGETSLPPPAPSGARGKESPQRTPSQQDPTTSTGTGSEAPQPSGEPLTRVSDEALRPEPGNSEADQLEMANPEGNASLLGDVSLNTLEWEYAPWLQRFAQQLRERWYAPPAYSLGILKEGGWAQIEVEISKSGKLLRLDLLEEQGHPSLIRAAQSALRSMAPIESLPPNFPKETLILRIRMIYPKYRPR